jgi:F420-dependent oxidoreductase-like protein
MDHFFQIAHIGKPEEPMIEAYTTLSYIAALTSKVKLGTMVTGVIYREPALLIKAVTTLDVLSGGRAYLGIGAGWNDYEAKALGFMDPLHSNRFDRLEETLQIANQMWSDEDKPYKGKYYNLGETMNHPQSITRPHPPILIGGSGEQKTLRLVAQYADSCNLFAADVDVLKSKLDVLRKHCSDLGRNYDDIEKTVLLGMDVDSAANNPDALVEKVKLLSGLGISHGILANSASWDASSFTKLEPVIKEVASL